MPAVETCSICEDPDVVPGLDVCLEHAEMTPERDCGLGVVAGVISAAIISVLVAVAVYGLWRSFG